MPDRPVCPEHSIPDCSPLLNGCTRLSRPQQAVEDPDRLLPEVMELMAVVRVDGVSLVIRRVHDAEEWTIDLSNGVVPCGGRQPLTDRRHRDREAAVTAATMLAVEFAEAERLHYAATRRANAAIEAYAQHDPGHPRL